MKRRNAGFSLVEMLVVIAIFGFALAGTSQMFISMMHTHRQQSRLTETNIEGVIGLELLRQDLEKAGYGLPWNGTFAYSETSSDPYSFNQTSDAPKGIVSANDVTSGVLPNTDYLVIRASNIATNQTCGKWAFLPVPPAPPTQWRLNSGATATSENFSPNDRVIVISPGIPNTPSARNLVNVGGQWRPQFNAITPSFAAPVFSEETRVIYGIDPDTNPRMPFNRADYYVKMPLSSELPRRCAPTTGILYKAVVRHSDGGLQEMPLLDCVADMQIVFRLDRNSDGIIDDTTNILTNSGIPLTAEQTRTQVKEVRVYILAHEGQKDVNYKHPDSSPIVGDYSLGRSFNLSTITDWQNYRWKIYTLVVKLNNLQ